MAVEKTFESGLERMANELAEVLQARLKEALEKTGKIASGDLAGSIQARGRTDGSKAVIEVYAEDHFRFVDQGRRPGKFPPLAAIRSWVQLKGISEEAVFPIARKIATVGIPATPIINPTLDAVLLEFQPKYEKELEKIVGAVLVNDVFSNTNTKGRIIPKSLRQT